MRLRRRNKKTVGIMPEAVFSERARQGATGLEESRGENLVENPQEDLAENGREQFSQETSPKKPRKKSQKQAHDKVKIAKPVDDTQGSLFRRILQNPNFSSQIMVIVFSLLSDNMPMQRPLENMTSAIDKVRNISDVLNNTMQSVKVASEVPKQIRRLLK